MAQSVINKPFREGLGVSSGGLKKKATKPGDPNPLIGNAYREGLGVSSGGLGVSSGGLNKKATETGTPNPLIDNTYGGGLEVSSGGLGVSSEGLEELKSIAAVVANRKKAPRALVESTILKLCRQKELTLDELSKLLDRSAIGLQKEYLQPLIKQKQLLYRHANIPNHPDQAYKTNKEMTE